MTWEQVADFWLLGFGITVIGGLWAARRKNVPRDELEDQLGTTADSKIAVDLIRSKDGTIKETWGSCDD